MTPGQYRRWELTTFMYYIYSFVNGYIHVLTSRRLRFDIIYDTMYVIMTAMHHAKQIPGPLVVLAASTVNIARQCGIQILVFVATYDNFARF